MLDARHDFEDVSKLTKAEMARFDKEKVDDFKKALEEYSESLAVRQREVSSDSHPLKIDEAKLIASTRTQVVSSWQHYTDLLVKVIESNASNPSPVATNS